MSTYSCPNSSDLDQALKNLQHILDCYINTCITKRKNTGMRELTTNCRNLLSSNLGTQTRESSGIKKCQFKRI